MVTISVFELWHWLRKGRRPQVGSDPAAVGIGRPAPQAQAPAGDPDVAASALAGSVPMPVCGEVRQPTPFWTASGVSGMLGARRPCGLLDSGAGEIAAAPANALTTAKIVETAPILSAALDPSATLDKGVETVPLYADGSTLALRLRHVREANRPVRAVPGLKRQARDVLAKTVAAAPKARTAPATPQPADDPSSHIVRSRPVLVYAAA